MSHSTNRDRPDQQLAKFRGFLGLTKPKNGLKIFRLVRMPPSAARHLAIGNSTNSKAIGRFCMLAVGLGIGASAVASPTAAAQPGVPVDPVPVVPDLALPA